MAVRGAPAIGAAGAFGMVLAVRNRPNDASDEESLLNDLLVAKALLDRARPTAVNLSWATQRMVDLSIVLQRHSVPLSRWPRVLLEEAKALSDEDVLCNKRLGDFGASQMPTFHDKERVLNVLHHCNTGCLATVDYGTALGVVYSLFYQKRPLHVWVDETRPRLQGSRLTAWELMREQVPMSLIVDNAAGLLMWQGKVDVVLFGADRVTRNGDTANKIGTYEKAVLAHVNNIPVYACVPTSTIDLTLASGELIPIEERSADEVTHPQDPDAPSIAPPNVKVFNPAFDVTPARFITAIITEEGICHPPFEQSLAEAKKRAQDRVAAEWKERLQRYLNESS